MFNKKIEYMSLQELPNKAEFMKLTKALGEVEVY